MKLNELLNEAWEYGKSDLEFATAFLKDKGIVSASDINTILSLARQHHAEAGRIEKEVGNQHVMAHEKILSGKEFFKLVTDLRKGLAKARSAAPVDDGSRHIEAVTDPEKIEKMTAFVKTHNKGNKEDKLKLSVYDRKDGKKIWLDGSKDAIKKFKAEKF